MTESQTKISIKYYSYFKSSFQSFFFLSSFQEYHRSRRYLSRRSHRMNALKFALCRQPGCCISHTQISWYLEVTKHTDNYCKRHFNPYGKQAALEKTPYVDYACLSCKDDSRKFSFFICSLLI